MRDRFELESAIMEAWITSDDIALVLHNTDNLDLNAKDFDRLQNQLIGLMAISELRFEKLWHIMEELIKQGDLK